LLLLLLPPPPSSSSSRLAVVQARPSNRQQGPINAVHPSPYFCVCLRIELVNGACGVDGLHMMWIDYARITAAAAAEDDEKNVVAPALDRGRGREIKSGVCMPKRRAAARTTTIDQWRQPSGRAAAAGALVVDNLVCARAPSRFECSSS
jgi:hypothetical protein